MRRSLLAAVAFAAALIAAAPSARAQWTVICPTCAQELSTRLSWVKQAADMARQISGDVARLQALRAQLEALTRATDLGSAVSALQGLGIQNPLPINPYAAQNLMNGTGGTQGMLGSVGSLYSGAYASNQVYNPIGNLWIVQQIRRHGSGIAGGQAMAMQLYQSAGARVVGLNQLQARINAATTPAEREALIARLAAEQAYIQNQMVQAQAVAAYMQSQTQVQQQQQQERLLQSLQASLAQARARGLWR
jgi:type IV secretion system protein VirB5